jgi:hypothetical protein
MLNSIERLDDILGTRRNRQLCSSNKCDLRTHQFEVGRNGTSSSNNNMEVGVSFIFGYVLSAFDFANKAISEFHNAEICVAGSTALVRELLSAIELYFLACTHNCQAMELRLMEISTWNKIRVNIHHTNAEDRELVNHGP